MTPALTPEWGFLSLEGGFHPRRGALVFQGEFKKKKKKNMTSYLNITSASSPSSILSYFTFGGLLTNFIHALHIWKIKKKYLYSKNGT